MDWPAWTITLSAQKGVLELWRALIHLMGLHEDLSDLVYTPQLSMGKVNAN